MAKSQRQMRYWPKHLNSIPNQETLEYFASKPGLLHDILLEWWAEAVENADKMVDGDDTDLPVQFCSAGYAIVFWSDARGIDARDIYRVIHLLMSTRIFTRCHCGGTIKTETCDRCGSSELKNYNWQPPRIVQEIMELAQGVKERIEFLARQLSAAEFAGGASERREKLCYELSKDMSNTWPVIQEQANCQFPQLPSLDSGDGKAAKAAAKRYADKHKLEMPRKSQGRPRTKKP